MKTSLSYSIRRMKGVFSLSGVASLMYMALLQSWLMVPTPEVKEEAKIGSRVLLKQAI